MRTFLSWLLLSVGIFWTSLVWGAPAKPTFWGEVRERRPTRCLRRGLPSLAKGGLVFRLLGRRSGIMGRIQKETRGPKCRDAHVGFRHSV